METNLYKIKDLYLAAFLYAQGMKLSKTEKQGSTYWFYFENRKLCEKRVSDYWIDEAMIKAKRLNDAIKTMKDIIFA